MQSTIIIATFYEQKRESENLTVHIRCELTENKKINYIYIVFTTAYTNGNIQDTM